MSIKQFNSLIKRLDSKNLSRKKKSKYLHKINIIERKEFNKLKEIFYIKNFYLDDGCFYCNKEVDITLHETHIEVRTLTRYDVEYGRLQKPSIINRLKDNYLYLVCSCGEIEDISGEFMIEDDYIVKRESKGEINSD